MNNNIFRQKSVDRVTSPEQLNDYIRVTNPGVWIMLVAILLLLAGVCVWGAFGKLDTVLTVGAITENGQTVCYVREKDIDGVNADMPVVIDDTVYGIRSVSLQPVQVNAGFSEYLVHVGGLSRGEWVYALTLNEACGDDGGIYKANIIVESIAPMSFVMN